MRLDAIPTADTSLLERRFVELAEKLSEIETERMAIASELSSREKQVAATMRLSSMSDSDKQVLRRILR